MGGFEEVSEIALIGYCPDCDHVVHCLKSQTNYYCRDCGRTNMVSALTGVRETNTVLTKLLQHTRRMSTSLELVAFRGVHNFEAKLLSPFLARYGMDGNGRPKLLSELNPNRSAHFNCGALSNKSFVMPESDYKIPGAGQDLMVAQTGYLAETLSSIDAANGVKMACIAAHADPDGHCLVHAVSRAITGTQLFWHPLRHSIKKHITENLTKYRQ